MKKVCILSMQQIDNYGSVLQAYCLKKIIESMNCTVSFIDIKKIEEDYKLQNNKLLFNAELESKSRTHKFDRFILNRLYHQLTDKKYRNTFSVFRNEKLNIGKNKDSHYDLCIIGSDEVFNCCNPGWWGFTSQLFGNVPEADHVITYAASCGATKFSDLTDDIKNKIRSSFKRIEGISVRDENTRFFVNELVEKKNIIENLDPVLLYDFSEELKRTSLVVSSKKKYCVIYSYTHRINNKEEYIPILNFCKSHGLIPIAVGGKQFWCKDYVICSPFECLKIFQNSDYVITDTFHGTIFAAKYAKRYAVIIRESNRNKLQDLATRIHIEDHIVSNMGQIGDIYKLNHSKNRLFDLIANEELLARQYLKEFI